MIRRPGFKIFSLGHWPIVKLIADTAVRKKFPGYVSLYKMVNFEKKIFFSCLMIEMMKNSKKRSGANYLNRETLIKQGKPQKT